MSHLRLCEYRSSQLDFVMVTIRRYSRRLRWFIVKYSDWAPEITIGANLVGCPLYKVLICKTKNQIYMEEKQ